MSECPTKLISSSYENGLNTEIHHENSECDDNAGTEMVLQKTEQSTSFTPSIVTDHSIPENNMHDKIDPTISTAGEQNVMKELSQNQIGCKSKNVDETNQHTNIDSLNIGEDENEYKSEHDLSEPSTPLNETDVFEPIVKDDKTDIKENVYRNVMINDDAIFVKPRDKDRNICYCGKDRNLNIVELLCANCNRWFHESCISYQFGKLVPFLINYSFMCKNCSINGLEVFRKGQATIPQLCATALANLIQASIKDGKPKQYFSKDEIITYIESHWEGMTTTARRVTQSWRATVSRTLQKDTNNFRSSTDDRELTFSLFNPDVTQVKPSYDSSVKGGTGLKSRGTARRKLADTSIGTGKRTRIETVPVKLSAHGYPLEHPFNKDGFRYFLAEPDPQAPYRQEFDESSELAGKPIPGWLYRPLCPNSVLLALHDRAPQLKVSEDRLSVTGEKGYCMIRATHFVSKGTWYFEVNVDEMKDGSACRIGWGQAFANLQTPLGFDKFGYCWRSRKGTKFHEARGKHYSEGFGEGDTLGLLISLPETENNVIQNVQHTMKDRPLVKFKSHLYYEEKDSIPDILKKLTTLEGSKIIFFRNGEYQGIAYSDIYKGQYYPTLSLYKSCVLSINFGPNFKYPPSVEKFKYTSMFERAEQYICEQTLSDIVFLNENEGKLKLDL